MREHAPDYKYKMLDKMKVNDNAVAEFLTLGFVLGDNTFREGEKAERIVDVPEFETNRNSSVSDVEESFKASIENAVRGKENVAIHLSGGKDTRLIVTLAHSLGIDFTAVTYGEKGSVDIEIAKKVAKKMRLQHRISVISPNDFSVDNIYEVVKATEGLVPFTSFVGGYQSNKKLFPEFDVVLAGSLMSEIMDTWDFKRYPKDPLEAMKKRWGYLPIVKAEYLSYIDDKLKDMYDGKSLEEILCETTIKNLFLRSLGFYIARGINICPVVLDTAVLSNVYSLPHSKRRNCYLAKKIIKRVKPELLYLPYSYSGYMIPLAFPYIIHQGLRVMHTRGKKRFFGPTNVADHLRYSLRDFIESKIDTLNIDLVSHDMANKLLQEHLAGDYNTSAIGRLVTLKIWMEKQ
jgi:hypothetical protein